MIEGRATTKVEPNSSADARQKDGNFRVLKDQEALINLRIHSRIETSWIKPR